MCCLQDELNDEAGNEYMTIYKEENRSFIETANQSADGKQMDTRFRDVYIQNLIEIKIIIHCNKCSLGRWKATSWSKGENGFK